MLWVCMPPRLSTLADFELAVRAEDAVGSSPWAVTLQVCFGDVCTEEMDTAFISSSTEGGRDSRIFSFYLHTVEYGEPPAFSGAGTHLAHVFARDAAGNEVKTLRGFQLYQQSPPAIAVAINAGDVELQESPYTTSSRRPAFTFTTPLIHGTLLSTWGALSLDVIVLANDDVHNEWTRADVGTTYELGPLAPGRYAVGARAQYVTGLVVSADPSVCRCR